MNYHHPNGLSITLIPNLNLLPLSPVEPSHFIPCSLHFWSHFIPKGKMCSLHPMFTSYLESLHTLSHFILEVTSYQCTSYQVQFILSHFIPSGAAYQVHF